MPLPFLIAVAAYVGAKKGAKEAIESSQQDGSSLQRELNRPTYVDVSVTNIQKVAIDRLLSNVKYRVLNELRSRLQNDRIEVNFYALVLQKDRLNDFFQFYPALSQFFRQKVIDCIDSFLTELNTMTNQEKTTLLSPTGQSLSEVDPRERGLQQLESTHSENEKILLLKAMYRKKADQTIGHLCLAYNCAYKYRYKNILCSLQPHNLFTILKMTRRSDKETIFSLYCKAGLDVCDLISGCKEDPKVFCEIIEFFTIDNKTIQSLVNVFGLKKAIRTYLLNLPDTQTTWDLLDRCLNPATSIGNFCAKEANRTGLFQQGGTRETVQVLRDKVNARIIPITNAVLIEEHSRVMPPPSAPPLSEEETKNHLQSSSQSKSFRNVIAESNVSTTEYFHQPSETTAISFIPSMRNASEFWFYTTCATAIIAVGIAFLYAYLNTDVSTEAQNRLN